MIFSTEIFFILLIPLFHRFSFHFGKRRNFPANQKPASGGLFSKLETTSFLGGRQTSNALAGAVNTAFLYYTISGEYISIILVSFFTVYFLRNLR